MCGCVGTRPPTEQPSYRVCVYPTSPAHPPDASGCVQPRNDHYGIAFVCPNNQEPSGIVANNKFQQCAGIPPYFVNPKNPHCLDHVKFVGNDVNASVIDTPVINLPPAPTKKATGTAMILATVVSQPSAVLRYTTGACRAVPRHCFGIADACACAHLPPFLPPGPQTGHAPQNRRR